jgi:hypothetical protein
MIENVAFAKSFAHANKSRGHTRVSASLVFPQKFRSRCGGGDRSVAATYDRQPPMSANGAERNISCAKQARHVTVCTYKSQPLSFVGRRHRCILVLLLWYSNCSFLVGLSGTGTASLLCRHMYATRVTAANPDVTTESLADIVRWPRCTVRVFRSNQAGFLSATARRG